MLLSVTSVDYAPQELERAVPFQLQLLHQLPGHDRSDYWLAQVDHPIALTIKDQAVTATHFIVGARWQGTKLEPNVEQVPINLAAVLDPRQLEEAMVDFAKSEFIAIGVASEIGGGNRPEPQSSITAGLGRIGAFFGRGTR